MAGNVKEFTDTNFEGEVLSSAEPVLVDFWAPWCGPCRQIAPMIEQLANENVGSIKIGKVNTDENPQISSKYSIDSIPTLMFFKGGQPVQRLVGGGKPKSALQTILDELKG